MINVLYIYGYGSSPESRTYLVLKNLLHDVNVISVNYNQIDPEEGINTLIDAADYNCINLVIGSSLGGWFAMNVCASMSIPCILINPLTEETLLPTLKKVSDTWWPTLKDTYGEYINKSPLFTQVYHEDDTWSLEKWDPTENGLVAWLIWSDNDEVINRNRIPDTLKSNIKNITVAEGGSHRLTSSQLRKYVVPAYEKLMSELVPKYNDFYSKTYLDP